jgi:hypothetical protein
MRTPSWPLPAGASALLLLLTGAAPAQPPPVAFPVPLAVHEGRCTCVLPTERPDRKYFLILGCLARGAGPYSVRVRTEAVADPVSVPRDTPTVDPAWQRRTRDVQDRLAEARRRRSVPCTYPPGNPPRRRTFYVFTREDNFQDAAGYVAVQGDLQAVGRHCQVYLDHEYTGPAGLRPTVADIVRTFDEDVYPRAAGDLGQALDVDRDGRFTILLTNWLGKLQNGRVSVGGFVRGSDFYADLPAPYGNRCDMMYLNTDLAPGPHLRTLLAHEYTHAVVFSEHVFGDYLPEVPRQDEEGWLNEGLAHTVEERHAYGWSNLDYRVSAFLSAPERYRLVVPDYYAAGLWRNPGSRGATYLFLRWCLARHGNDLAARLVQTNQRGVDNLETATGERFEDLFRQWSAALLLAGTNLGVEAAPPFGPRLDPRRLLGGRVLAGPRFVEVPLAGGGHEARLAGTSTACLLLHSPVAPRTRVTIAAEAGAVLQVSLVRLPDEMARLTLRREDGEWPGTVRLVLTAHDTAVTVDEAAWEPLLPRAGPPDNGGFPLEGWCAGACLRPGDTRTSPSFPLPAAAGGSVFKVTATDAAGHHLAAWALFP